MTEYEELITETRRIPWRVVGYLTDALEAAERERDEWRHLHEQVVAAQGTRAEHAERERDEFAEREMAWHDAYLETLNERDEAVADNAALLVALKDAIAGYADAARYKGKFLFNKHGGDRDIAWLRGIAKAEHPGAALLARMERLEAAVQAAKDCRDGKCRDGRSSQHLGHCRFVAALDAISESEAAE